MIIKQPMRTSSLDHQYPLEVQIPREQEILHPGDHDVLLGRGGGTNSHAGNINFRELVKQHKKRYLAATKMDKPKVAKEVVEIWTKLDPPGRFLARRDEPKKGPGSVRDEDIIWIEVDAKESRKKASQCLRERTDDVKEYLEHLREQQDKQTEEGVDNLKEKIHHANDLHVSTPDSTGSSSTAKVRNWPSPHAEDDSILHMPDRPFGVNIAPMRRTSMPATAHSFVDGLGTGIPRFRNKDRRTSMPVGGKLPQSNQEIDFDLLMANHREVMRDAYTVVERSADLSPTGIAGLQVQQRQLFEPTRARMLQTNGMPMSHPMTTMNGIGIPFPPNGIQGLGQQISLTFSAQQNLMQQQRLLAQQQQQILREQECLARQEQLIAQMARQGQASNNPPQVASPLQPASAFSQMHISQAGPMAQYGNMYAIQSHGLESLQEEDDTSRTLNLLEASNPQSEHSSATQKIQKSSFKKSSEDSTPRAGSRELNTEDEKTQEFAVEDHPSYRKTLETYIANNQGSPMTSLELPSESFEESRTINGREADEWIEEQVFNNSGDMSVSYKGSLRRERTVARTKSNKSVDQMSLMTGTIGSTSGGDHMSFAFSEMDESVELEDLSRGDRDNSKRTSKRSMSILSIGTAMSELSDFDLGDLDGL